MVQENTDFDVQLWFVKFYQKGGTLQNKTITDALNSGYVGYPPLPYYLISKLPQKYWVIVGVITNVIIYDTLATIVVYIVSGIAFEQLDVMHSTILSPSAMCALVYSTSPILHPVTSRLTAMGGRTLGGLLSLIFFISLAAADFSQNYGYFIVSAFFGTIIVLSSRFGLQVLVLFTIGLSIFYQDWIPTLILLGILACGASVPQLGIRQQLVATIAFYKWFLSDFVGPPIQDRNSIARFGTLLHRSIFSRKRKESVYGLMRFLYTKITPFILLYSVPPLLFVLYWLVKEGSIIETITSRTIVGFALRLVSVSLIVFSLTSIKPFLFLGQAERYLEYSAAFIAFLFVYYGLRYEKVGEFVILIVLFQLGVVILNFLYVVRMNILDRLRLKPGCELEALVNYISNSAAHKIISIPTKLNAKLGVHLDGKFQFYYYHAYETRNRGLQRILDDHVAHLLPMPEMHHFVDKYGADTLVLSKPAISRYEDMGLEFSVDKLMKLYESENYLVFDIRDCTTPKT